MILAFNGDLESRLAIHWLVHERGYEVITLSLNLGQEQQWQELGELALELGAVAARVIDSRELFVQRFAIPVLQAGAIYQKSCYLGSALARYVIAEELVNLAGEEGCTAVSHCGASKGNDQVRLETAIAALNPDLKVVAPVRLWHLRTLEDKISYARRNNLPIEEPSSESISIDQNLWGVSIYLHDLHDAWTAPPDNAYVMTRAPDQAPAKSQDLTIAFEAGIPISLDGRQWEPVALVRELNGLAGKYGIGRSDVVEDRLFGIKSREIYEAPAACLLQTGYRELESLVLSRELRQFKEIASQRYAELAYTGLWFHDLRYGLDALFRQTVGKVSGEVRFRLHPGYFSVLGRRSPHSLFDSALANQSNLEMFEDKWAEGFTTLWTLSSRMAGRRHASGGETVNDGKPRESKM